MKTKIMFALALCASATAAFAGQENRSPLGGPKDKQGAGQQQPQDSQPQDQGKQQDEAQQQDQGDDQHGQQEQADEQPQ